MLFSQYFVSLLSELCKLVCRLARHLKKTERYYWWVIDQPTQYVFRQSGPKLMTMNQVIFLLIYFHSQVEYADESQVSFLRLIYTAASQKLTYFCSNSVAYKDSATSDTSNAITLLGHNDFEFGNKALRKKYVLLDGCVVSNK